MPRGGLSRLKGISSFIRDFSVAGLGLGCDQEGGAVLFAETGLLNLAGRISGNVGEDDLDGPLVARELLAEVADIFFSAGIALFDLDDRGGYLAQALVREADE